MRAIGPAATAWLLASTALVLPMTGKQSLAIVVVALYAFTVSFVLAKMIDWVMGFRVSGEDETAGVDFTQHAETAYPEGVHAHLPGFRPGIDNAPRRP